METPSEAEAVCSVKRRHYFSGCLSTVTITLFRDTGGYRTDTHILTLTGNRRGRTAVEYTETASGTSVSQVFEAARQSSLVAGNHGLDTFVDMLERKVNRLPAGELPN